ncbi:hypothetical protein Tco_0277535 [Tanacetum coccineum]
MAYCLDLILMARAFFASASSVPSVRYWIMLCSFAMYDLLIGFATKWELTFNSRFFTPICSAIRGPATRASYYASLLDASNSDINAYVNSIPSGFVRMSPAPDTSRHEDQSMKRIYGSGISSSAGVSVGGLSSFGLLAIQFAKTCGWIFAACS